MIAIPHTFPNNRVVRHALAQLPLCILCSMVDWDQLGVPLYWLLCNICVAFLVRGGLDRVWLLKADFVQHVGGNWLCFVHAG